MSSSHYRILKRHKINLTIPPLSLKSCLELKESIKWSKRDGKRRFHVGTIFCTKQLLPPANEVWGKVIFSEACVKNSVHGGGRAWPGARVLPGGRAWPGGCMACTPPRLIPRDTVGQWAGGTHPTGMHSCSFCEHERYLLSAWIILLTWFGKMPCGNDLVLSYGICLVLKCAIRQFLVETFKIFEVQRNSVNDGNSMCIVNLVFALFISFNSEVHNLPLVKFVR